MKKLITVITLLLSCICINGCSVDNQKIVWNMDYIQGKHGEVIYCSDENKYIYPNADIKNITCILQDSFFTITDNDTDNKWIGTYKIIAEDSNSSIYGVKFDNNKTGHLIKSFTKYADNTQHNTMIISCEKYSLTFTLP